MPDASVPDTTPPMGIHKKLCTGALEQGIRIRMINIQVFNSWLGPTQGKLFILPVEHIEEG